MEYENRNIGKPDKKQWLPIYGVFKVAYDFGKKPTIIDKCDYNSLKFYGIVLYHGIAGTAVIGGAIYALHKLL